MRGEIEHKHYGHVPAQQEQSPGKPLDAAVIPYKFPEKLHFGSPILLK
jgi:hypothetical protein